MMKKELHNHLIDNITRAIGDSCETENHVIMKVIEHVNQTTRHSIEPGVELVDSLEKVFRGALAHAVRLKCDLKVIVKGLIIGTFRSNVDVKMEAHKTIDHMIRLVVQTIYELKGNVPQAVQGMLEGIAESAKEAKLNRETALSEAARDAVRYASSLSDKYGAQVREAAARRVMDVDIKIAPARTKN